MKQEFAARYGDMERWHWWFCGRRRILDAVLRTELGRSPCRTIVSVGCGPAEGLGWLRAFTQPGGCVLGLDLDVTHAATPPDGIRCVIGRLEAAPLASGLADAALALDVLEHLEDDAAGLRETARLVRPGGLLLITVPAFERLWGSQDVVSHHRRRYTRRTLAALFARARLPAPRLTYFNTLLFLPVAGIRVARRVLGFGGRARSDFDDNRPGLVNDVLERIFAAERFLVPHVSLPVGVSLLATVHLPAEGHT
jgi:SAM-dependent methyltransferase